MRNCMWLTVVETAEASVPHQRTWRCKLIAMRCHYKYNVELHVIVSYFSNRRPVSSIGKGEVCRAGGRGLNPRPDQHSRSSLLGRRLEVVGAIKNGAREGDTRGKREPPVSLIRAPVFFAPKCFQAPAKQATQDLKMENVLPLLCHLQMVKHSSLPR